MKVDFHCHTQAIFSNEAKTRTVSSELFAQKIEASNVKCIAITNHNHFCLSQFITFRSLVKEKCQVWPGIELTIRSEIKEGHVILIWDPDIASSMDEALQGLPNYKNPEIFSLSCDELINFINTHQCIAIAHYLKHKSLDPEDLNYIYENIINKKRFLHEPGSLTSLGVLHCHNHRAIIGSDVQDWASYENCTFGELKFSFESYTRFEKFVDKNTLLVHDLLYEDFSEEVTVFGKHASREFPYKIPVFRDVNIIFGNKGSGKSEILDSLYDYYALTKNTTPVRYSGGEKEQWYTQLLSVQKERYDCSLFNFGDNKSLTLSSICDFLEANINQTSEYLAYFKNTSSNQKKLMMKSLNVPKFFTFSFVTCKKLSAEHKEIKVFYKKIINYEVFKAFSTQFVELEKQLLEFLSKAYNLAFQEWILQGSMRLVDHYVTSMNQFVSENVGTPVMPTETGFARFAQLRMNLLSNTNSFLNILDKPIDTTPVYIGNVGSKGEGRVKEIVVFDNPKIKESVDHKTLIRNKGDLSRVITDLVSIRKKVYLADLLSTIQSIKQTCTDGKIASLNDFLSIKKEFFLNDEPYSPSKGEKAVLAMQYDLLSKRDNSVFLLDEPELSLGSYYINETLVPVINNLAINKKIVVIATHDANIAVRTRPINSILKVVHNEVYSTYLGNMFTGKMINIDGSQETLSWRQESIKHLEGGEEAFNERGYLYE